ncbi:Helix-turn-helix domain-containing protein [Bradyrhizobium shewense]|uniref:Helix-turn-helix domain-containing protein n=1 Tax=Bradyrhizobium shewense TaxID=1761772 RepID=A0A1C3U3L9_9BRAD|nr:AraC family transcriptional regulator [Bradyrhizobium shewense]SCB09945.1 Helix-turn-helix domain-containing protein [Bradyrhizobium shewense]
MSELPEASRPRGAHAYGTEFADCFGMPEPPTHVHRTLRRGLLAVTELRFDQPIEQSASLGYDDAFLASVFLKDITDHECWYNGRPVQVESWDAGKTYIFDLRQDPRALVRGPSHVVHFYLPLATLNSFAEQNDSGAVSELVHKPGIGGDDGVMRHLARAGLAALRDPHATTSLLLDELLNAACAHALGRYGSARFLFPRAAGLAQWQERRAKDMMSERMDVSLSELAQECGLSITQFARAFRYSTGMSPHRWLIAQRVSVAKNFLEQSNLTLTEIATLCGFSSQSHLNAAFKQHAGLSPGRWRRTFKS